jgi:NitT/TauT family transport system permease protein
LSSQVADLPVVEAGSGESQSLPPATNIGFVRAALTVLAPPVAGLVAITLHQVLPNRQLLLLPGHAVPTGTYLALLEILVAATAVLALVHWAWRPLRDWARHNGPLFAGVFLLLAIWDLITLKLAWMPLPYFPGPDVVFDGMLEDSELLLDSTYCSLRLLMSGYLAGVAAGVVSGVLIGWFRVVRYWAMPALKFIGPIPATALVPLALVLFATTFQSGTALIAWAVWFPVTMLTTSGIANVPVSYLDVARTLGAGRGYLIFRVAIPSALPTIFVGVFMGLLVAFLALAVAETVGVKNGLGYYVTWRQGYAEYGKVYGALVIMAAFFSGLLTLLFKLRDRVLVWQKGVIQW